MEWFEEIINKRLDELQKRKKQLYDDDCNGGSWWIEACAGIRELTALLKEFSRYDPHYGRLKWDDNQDPDAICKCGHTYHRHFDGYEGIPPPPVGCKYCCCLQFEPNEGSDEKHPQELCSLCRGKLQPDGRTCAKCGKEVETWDEMMLREKQAQEKPPLITFMGGFDSDPYSDD